MRTRSGRGPLLLQLWRAAGSLIENVARVPTRLLHVWQLLLALPVGPGRPEAVGEVQHREAGAQQPAGTEQHGGRRTLKPRSAWLARPQAGRRGVAAGPWLLALDSTHLCACLPQTPDPRPPHPSSMVGWACTARQSPRFSATQDEAGAARPSARCFANAASSNMACVPGTGSRRLGSAACAATRQAGPRTPRSAARQAGPHPHGAPHLPATPGE